MAILTKNTVFREVVNDEVHENILSLALHALPQHGNGAVLTPRQSPPRPLPPLHVSVKRSSAGEGGETLMTTMMILEAIDNAHGVRPRSPNTQQPAIAGGEGGNDKDDKEESKLGKGR